MSINTHVTRCASKTLVFPIWYMLVSIQIYIFFGESKIDDMNYFLFISGTTSNEEIFWFDITINQMSKMYIFYPMELVEENTHKYTLNDRYVVDILTIYEYKWKKKDRPMTPNRQPSQDIYYYIASTYQLCCYVENGFKCKSPPAQVKQVFETWTKEFHH